MRRPASSASGLARLFGSSIADQAMLSAANFAVGLILIRYAAEAQYGYYILAFNTMMLLTTLQGTFIGTPMVIRLPGLDGPQRRQWMGSLLRDQKRLGLRGGLLALAVILGVGRRACSTANPPPWRPRPSAWCWPRCIANTCAASC